LYNNYVHLYKLAEIIKHPADNYVYINRRSALIILINLKQNKIMATITLKGNLIHTLGELPDFGDIVPNVELTKNDLSRVMLKDYFGSKLVLNIFPSLDTSTCAMSVRTFNKKAAELKNTKILCISRDLPFAQARFCGTEGINNAITLSDFASRDFGKKYQLEIIDGAMAGLLSRVVIVLDKKGRVVYKEQVPEIANEPNYQKALDALVRLDK
jgi:thiol peroxidase